MTPPSVPHLRTPAERFSNLPGFPYKPHYLNYGNMRIAYIDEKSGDNNPEVFLCIHGQPTWSYLYRKMIPIFLNYTTLATDRTPSRRVVAADLLGFGRSDKPSRDEDYTFEFHRETLLHLVRALDLTNVTLVVQDWGGLLGLTLPIAEPTRFKRLIVMNTTLGVGATPTQGFLDWLAFTNRSPDMNVGRVIAGGTKHLSQAEIEAYNAPFPNKDYKGGVRRFPNLVMIREDMEGVDVSKKSLQMYKTEDLFRRNDVFMACEMKDPVLGPPVMESLARVWKNGCFYTEIADAGHFVQEWGDHVARLAIATFEKGDVVEGSLGIPDACCADSLRHLAHVISELSALVYQPINSIL